MAKSMFWGEGWDFNADSVASRRAVERAGWVE